MNGSLKIGSIFGIPILLHWSFLIIIPLLAWLIGSQVTLTTQLIEGFLQWFVDVQYLFLGAPVPQIQINTDLITAGYNAYILGAIIAISLFIGVLTTRSLIPWSPKGRGSRSTASRCSSSAASPPWKKRCPTPPSSSPWRLQVLSRVLRSDWSVFSSPLPPR